MTSQHPITPPPELVAQWGAMFAYCEETDVFLDIARWGADQELEACVEWAATRRRGLDADLRAARRPEPPSLKEQALEALAEADGADYPVVCTTLTADQHALIRRALEALPDE